MKREYIIINSKKLKIPNWSKWLILFLISNIIQIAIYVPVLLIGFRLGVGVIFNARYQITWFISALIILTLIYDLAPKLKKFFSVMVSLVYILLLFGIRRETGWISFLITFIIIILYNIVLYKKKINEN
jgi:hypothetical protein